MSLLSLLVFENLAALENPLPGRQGAAASLMGREVGPRWLGGGLGPPRAGPPLLLSLPLFIKHPGPLASSSMQTGTSLSAD